MPWVWTCHLCRSHYPLGATRRCLEDGHYFCAGTSIDRLTGTTKKHKACASEFDYTGWKTYGDWRRRCHEEENPDFVHGSKDCSQHCDHPSECRWTAKRAAKSSRFGDDTLGGDKRSKTRLARLVESAERRTAQLDNRLSPVEEEGEQSPSTTRNGLGLTSHGVDFSSNFDSFKTTSDDGTEKSKSALRVLNPDFDDMDVDPFKLSMPQVSVEEVEVDSGNKSMDLDPSYERSEPKITIRAFEFGFGESQAYGQTSPTSPRRNAWDWSIGGIGAALTFVEDTEVSESSSEEDIY